MRITYLLTTVDAKAGTERTFIDQANSMAARGHQVTIASVYHLNQVGFPWRSDVSVDYISDLGGPTDESSLIIPKEWDNQFCQDVDSMILAYLGAGNADVIVTSTPALTTYALIASPKAARVVQQEHRPSMTRGITATPLLRQAQRVDALVSLTQRNADWLSAQFGGRGPRIEVIGNALPDTVRPMTTCDPKVIMGAGRLVRSKGFADVIRAFGRIAEDFPDWTLRIFGDGPERKNLHKLVVSLDVEAQVEIIPPTDDILTEWSRASIGALASTFEGLPLVIMEARGAGLPVVAYDCATGPAELLESGVDGYLVAQGDVEGFATALRMLMEDDSARRLMGSRGPSSMTRFAPKVITDQWEALYEDVLNRPSRRGEQLNPLNKDGVESHSSQKSIESANFEHWESNEAADLLLPVTRERSRRAIRSVFENREFMSRCVSVGGGAAKWILRSEDKESFLETLSGSDVLGLRARLYAGTLRLDQDGLPAEATSGIIDPASVTRAYLYLEQSGPDGLHVGYKAGWAVEFWETNPENSGTYSSNIRNQEFDTLRVAQFEHLLFELPERSVPLWDEVTEPIDVVYTWVDGSDQEWAARKQEFSSTSEDQHLELAAGDIRYRNRNELRYSLRSIAEYAPWVRNIYIVTDRQVPEWLVEDRSIRVIDHSELFESIDSGPVFNSHAIETLLHKIPGLSENFLYFNDDVFLMRPQSPEQFFLSNGQAKFFASPTKINALGEDAEPHLAAAMNNQALLRSEFGALVTKSMLHVPHPHRVSLLRALEERWPEEIEKTRVSKFRSATDYSLLSSLAQYFGYFKGSYVPGSIRVAFVSLGSASMDRGLRSAMSPNLDVLTFGEAEVDLTPERTDAAASEFLARKFPIPARWER